jgi:hypothetical protein
VGDGDQRVVVVTVQEQAVREALALKGALDDGNRGRAD